MSVTPAIGRGVHDLAPRAVALASLSSMWRWSAAAGTVVTELLAQRGAAFGDAAVHRGVGRGGGGHDLAVAVAEAFQVEGVALARLQCADGLQAGVVLDAVECVLVGAAAIGVA